MDAREIYEAHPHAYDELVRCEDREGNLLRALVALVPLQGCDVVELGAGTGRVTALLAPRVRSIRAYDVAAPMLEVARENLARIGARNCELVVADNTRLPAASESADLAIAGWSFGHQTVWNEQSWHEPVEAAVREMIRVLRPGGRAIIIETLGTGHSSPFDPPRELARYYALLEGKLGFARTWIRTDYEFSSMKEGERLVRFFFGDERAQLFAAAGSLVLPECTAIFWRERDVTRPSPRPSRERPRT